MRRAATRWTVAASVFVAGICGIGAECRSAVGTSRLGDSATVPGNQAKACRGSRWGKLHGVVKSGNIPLPGVTVTAQNTLTGKRYSTTTDITGAWSMTIPQNGRYVIRTQFAAFAAGDQEALLNAANHDQTVNFELMLASRAAAQEQQQQGAELAGGTGHAATGGQRRAEPESGKRIRVGYRDAGRRRRRERGSTAVDRRQLRLQRGFCGDQRAGGRGKSAGRRGYGSAARCDGDIARAKRRPRREFRRWRRAVWRRRIWRAGRFRRRRLSAEALAAADGRRQRRNAQLPRLQSRPAPRRHLIGPAAIPL